MNTQNFVDIIKNESKYDFFLQCQFLKNSMAFTLFYFQTIFQKFKS